jgi:four helix bundle suffix protein
VAAWVGEVHRSGQRGQSGPLQPSTGSTGSTAPRPCTYAEIAASAALTLVNVAAVLLDRRITAPAAAFEAEGGFTERLDRVRSQSRRALMNSTDHQRLIEKLRRIESLFADRAATDGEKAAAGEARERIRRTNRVIAESINKDTSDVEVRSGQALSAGSTLGGSEEAG